MRYNISGSGWFDNRFQSFMEAQAAAGQAEARAIVSSLKLTPTGEVTKTPYTGPNLNVTVPAEAGAEPTPPKTTPPTPPKTTPPTPPKTTPTPPPPVPGGEAAAKSEALIKEGTALHDQKKYPEAISSFTKAISFTPNSAEAYRRRAMSKRELKDFAGAITDFDKAIALEPNNARSYAGRGLAKERNGDVSGAVSDYTRAIQIDPRYENAYFYRAMIRYDQKDYRGALADYEQVIALNPKNAGAWNNRGSAKEKLGDVAGALRDYEQAVALDPNNEVARRNVERLRGAASNASGSKKDSGLIDLAGAQWNWFDPRADATGTVAGNALTITAPNGNDLWYEYNVDAPRLVRQVNGNFVLQVRVRGEFRYNYQGAGLLVYAGKDAVIRFERGNPGSDGQVVWLLGYQNQRDLAGCAFLYRERCVFEAGTKRSSIRRLCQP
ncbi:MAG: tetratricopeptide repeat protein [Blastocatellia bacterium]